MTRKFHKSFKEVDEKTGEIVQNQFTTELPRLRTVFKYKDLPIEVIGEINRLPSQTLPDQTLGVKDIVRRFVKGQAASTAIFEPVFDENMDLSVFTNRLHGIEMAEAQQQIQNLIDATEAQLKNLQNEAVQQLGQNAANSQGNEAELAEKVSEDDKNNQTDNSETVSGNRATKK